MNKYKIPKKLRGIIIGYKKITPKRDKEGRILTYLVQHKGWTSEHNTLKEAKKMASILGD